MSEEKLEFKSTGFISSLADLGISATEDDLVRETEIVSFGAGHFIAPWSASQCRYFMTSDDYITLNADVPPEERIPPPDFRYRTKTDKFMHYYLSHHWQEARDASEKVELIINPQQVWLFQTPTTSIINREFDADTWGETIHLHVRKIALQRARGAYSQNSRHPYNLIALPAAVAAAAQAMGLNVAFDISEVVASDDDRGFEWDDETFKSHFGDVDGDYKDAIYFKRRAALWAALGEPDPLKSVPKDTLTGRGKPSSKATTSDQLSACLEITQGTWKRPIWARIVNVQADPLPGNDYGFPILTELFKNEAHARHVVAQEAAERGEDVPVGQPALPRQWASSTVTDFVNFLKQFNGEPAPIAAKHAYVHDEDGEVHPEDTKAVEDWRAYHPELSA